MIHRALNVWTLKMNKFKIAVLLSGMARTYERTATSLFDNIIVNNDADLYVNIWDVVGHANPHKPKIKLGKYIIRNGGKVKVDDIKND